MLTQHGSTTTLSGLSPGLIQGLGDKSQLRYRYFCLACGAQALYFLFLTTCEYFGHPVPGLQAVVNLLTEEQKPIFKFVSMYSVSRFTTALGLSAPESKAWFRIRILYTIEASGPAETTAFTPHAGDSATEGNGEGEEGQERSEPQRVSEKVESNVRTAE